jgi:hypothetical protein
MTVEYRFEQLKQHKRFRAILKQIGLEKTA